MDDVKNKNIFSNKIRIQSCLPHMRKYILKNSNLSSPYEKNNLALQIILTINQIVKNLYEKYNIII